MQTYWNIFFLEGHYFLDIQYNLADFSDFLSARENLILFSKLNRNNTVKYIVRRKSLVHWTIYVLITKIDRTFPTYSICNFNDLQDVQWFTFIYFSFLNVTVDKNSSSKPISSSFILWFKFK